ncbi:MAG: exosortase O [Stenomitos frigidus ULC029]
MTWLERRRLGWRWLLVFVVNLTLLAIANVARVLTLVLVAHVWQQNTLSEILHVPLGVLTFVVACGCTLVLLRWVPHSIASVESDRQHVPSMPNFKLPFLLTACFLTLTLIPHPPAPAVPTVTNLHWSIAAQPQTILLTPTEQNFFASHPGVVAHKQRFAYQGLTGSVLLVSSANLQAHHAPELCLIASGFRLDHIAPQQFAAGPSARWLSLNDRTQTAIYWFQAPDQTTGDFLTRFWQEALRQQSSWTLVSILLDEFHNPDEATLQVLVTDIYQSLSETLQKA